ncbi:mRNA-decapping enzyme subunit 2 [Sporothrix stenoceras]|uniref:mRNA-decapping enzyme subunit 2 n=1 Tax=Sporothrix stenoceras TaxID=5173 RepID=A0ABR3Z3N9_9PEZI
MTSQKMTLDDWLDDLCVRFIINLPQADLASMARICFQVEEAHWFYDDFIRPLDRNLPPMSLRTFCLSIFKRCPLLAPFPIENHVRAFEEFLKYKTSIPVRGAILLNETMDMALLVKGWKKGANWSFPKGKINMDEDDLDCAVREVDEETGFDIRSAGLVPLPEDVKYIDTNFRDQQIRLYVFRNVPMDTHFEPKTRKEIGGIQWYKIADLPSYGKNKNNPNANSANANNTNGHETEDPTPANSNRFYMVAPFIGPLRKWIASQRKKDAARAGGNAYLTPQLAHAEDTYTEDEGNALPEPVPQNTTMDPNDILANANRELRQMLRMPPLPSDDQQHQQQQQQQYQQAPAVQPPPDAFADSSQNKANALLAVLQKGGTANAPPPPLPPPSGGQGGISLMGLLGQVSQQPQSNAPPQPQHQQYEPQQPPFQQQYQHQQPPPPHHQMPQPGPPPMQGQPSPGYGQYGAPRPNPQQQQQPQHQQQYTHAQQLAQQNQHLQQRFQLHGQQHKPQNYPYNQQQQQQQGQNINPFAPNPQAQPPPPYTANGQQAHAQAQAAAAAFRNQQHAPPPIPLLHPQPLPPVVQKAMFAREMLVSPDVGGNNGNNNNMMLPPPPPPPQQQQRGQQAPLSNHAAALLNTFKKDDGAPRQQQQQAGGGPQADAGGQDWPQQQSQQPRHASHAVPQQQAQQPQQPYATLPHNFHGAQPQPQPQPTSQHQYGALQTGGPPAQNPNQGGAPNPANGITGNFNQYLPRGLAGNSNNVNVNGPQVQPPATSIKHSEQHRSSLLGMFTAKQTTAPAQPAPTSGSPASAPAPAPPQHATLGRPGQAGGVTTQRTVYSATTISTTQGQGPGPQQGPGPAQGQAIEAAARANGGPIEMNAELNLPFGALSLLTRPKAQQSGSPSHNAGHNGAHPSTFASPITELPAETNTRLRKQPSLPRQVSQVSQPYSTSPSERRPSTRGSQPPPAYNTVGSGAPAVTATLPSHGIVRRPSYASSSSTAPVDHQAHQAQPVHAIPALNYPPTAAATGGVSVRADQPGNPEHKQKLLSLFGGKPQQPPQPQAQPAMSASSAAGVAGTGLHPYAQHQHQQFPQHGQQHGGAQLGPFEAADSTRAVEGPGSRRGSSQTPISPANRNFLLGYLASVSSSGAQ